MFETGKFDLHDPLHNGLQRTAAALRSGEITARELIDSTLHQIALLDVHLNAFLTLDADTARADAEMRDQELVRGINHGPLHGIPIAHKDLVRTKGLRTTAGSRILADYVPDRDASIVTTLRNAGSIAIGKTGLHEFAYGITSNNPHYGPVRNPWNIEHTPGGSSGGSAAAVAAGIVPFATGTDTGGSIRIPASFCGVVGLKPTFGRISVEGVIPLGITQDHLGPITRTVRDAAIAFNAMVADPAGYVPHANVSLLSKYDKRGMPIKIGVPKNFFFDDVDAEVRASVQAAIATAKKLGARIVEIEVPDMEKVRWAAFTSLLSEAAKELRVYMRGSEGNNTHRREDFGDDVRALVDQGLTIPAVDYIEALEVRRRIRREFARLFSQIDCIFTPTTPIVAPLIGQKTIEINGKTEEIRSAATRLTRGMNALGFPAISIPCGFSQAKLPIGLQIIGALNREDTIFRVAAAMEDALALTGERPPVFASRA